MRSLALRLVLILVVAMSGLAVNLPPAAAQEVELVEVEITTLPPVPGIEVAFLDEVAVTGGDGTATLKVPRRSSILNDLEIVTRELQVDDELRVKFTRIYRVDGVYVLALQTFRTTSFVFADSHDRPVDVSRIEYFEISNTLGEVIEDVDLTEPVWLMASRVVSTQRGPEIREIEWSIDEARVRSSNVVNRAQTRWFPSTQQLLPVDVLFFDADFFVPDLLFGYAHDGTLELTYPDGETISYELVEGQVSLQSLPRGEYTVVIDGAGARIERPVQLSRDQELEIELLSYLDMITVAAVLLFFLVVPLVFGRVRAYRRTRRQEEASAQADSAPAQTGEPEESPSELASLK